MRRDIRAALHLTGFDAFQHDCEVLRGLVTPDEYADFMAYLDDRADVLNLGKGNEFVINATSGKEWHALLTEVWRPSFGTWLLGQMQNRIHDAMRNPTPAAVRVGVGQEIAAGMAAEER